MAHATPRLRAGYPAGRSDGRILESADVPYVAIDLDSSLVLRERKNGPPVFYGDGRRPDVLRSAGVADAQLVIVTLDDFEATETVVSALHGECPDVPILARGQSARQCRRMLDLGRTEALLESFRREYYEHIDTEADDEARDRKSQA